MIKKIILRVLVFVVVMTGTAVLVNKISNWKLNGVSREMEEPTLPVAYCDFDGQVINRMSGYKQAMATGRMRDAVIPLSEDYCVDLLLDDANDYGKSYSYELRTIAGDSLIEEGELTPGEKKNGYDTFHIEFRMDLKKNREYVLVFLVNNGLGETVRYYTRVVNLDSHYASDLLAYATVYHNTTFVKNVTGQNGNIVSRSLKTTGEGDNNDLSHVTLESSYEMITFGGISPIVITPVVPKITEIEKGFAVIEMEYVAEAQNQGPRHHYNVDEYYTLEYDEYEQTAKILAFDRYMESIFDVSYFNKNNNSISLGIADFNSAEYVYSEDNHKLAFAKRGEIWYYNYDTTQLVSVFRFSQGGYTDERSLNTDVDVNIVNMDEDGNIYFVVYGYMCRGKHEGCNGISLYYFTAEDSRVQEKFFVKCDAPYDVMKQETGRFTYYDKAGFFYYLLDGTIYKVDLNNMTQNTMVYGFSSDKYVVSQDRTVVVYPMEANEEDNKGLVVHNFETGDEYTLQGTETERYLALGFVGNDLIYGISHKQDIYTAQDGHVILPLYKLMIISSDGEQLKEYSKANTYVMSARVEEDKIFLNRAIKNNNFFETCEGDSIAYKKSSEDDSLYLKYNYSSTELKQVDIIYPSMMFIVSNVKQEMTKAKDEAKYTEMEVKTKPSGHCYYVFTNGGYVGEFRGAAGAILEATSRADGLVVDENGNTVYRSIAADNYNTIAADITEQPCESVEDSLLTCAYMCIKYLDRDANYDDIMSCDSFEDAFEKYTFGVGINISGIDLSTALYFLDRDIPFVARIEEGQYVIVISYNSTHVRYYDPTVDGEVKVARKKFEDSLSVYGNTMYTYTSQ